MMFLPQTLGEWLRFFWAAATHRPQDPHRCRLCGQALPIPRAPRAQVDLQELRREMVQLQAKILSGHGEPQDQARVQDIKGQLRAEAPWRRPVD